MGTNHSRTPISYKTTFQFLFLKLHWFYFICLVGVGVCTSTRKRTYMYSSGSQSSFTMCVTGGSSGVAARLFLLSHLAGLLYYWGVFLFGCFWLFLRFMQSRTHSWGLWADEALWPKFVSESDWFRVFRGQHLGSAWPLVGNLEMPLDLTIQCLEMLLTFSLCWVPKIQTTQAVTRIKQSKIFVWIRKQQLPSQGQQPRFGS